MRIATWNLEYARGAEKNRRRLELLAEADADVWVLTETHDQLDLAAAWGSSWSAVTSTPRPDRTAERWVAIWCRLPIRHAVPTTDPCRTAAALLETPSGPLLVYGTVLPWHSDRGPDGSLRNWTEHHRVIPEQGHEWARLRDAFPDAPLCVAGDLNTTVDAPGYGTRHGRTLLASALDAADLVCPTAGPAPTAHLAPPYHVERAFIDHVCVTRALAAGASIVAAWEGTQRGVRLSDHSAVVLEVPALGMTTARSPSPSPAVPCLP